MNARIPRQPSAFRGHALLGAILLPAWLAATGCGNSDVRVPVFPVSGKVTVDGQPAVGAQVVLHRVDKSGESDVTPTASVKDDGSFAITAYEKGDGAPPGEYVATIQWFKIVPDLGGPGPNVIPKEYTSEKTSPIKVSVKEGPTTIDPIAIKL